MKTTILYIAICLCSFFLFSCKKYPEDGKWSKQRVRERLENKWELKECLVDDVELIDIQKDIKFINPSNQQIDSIGYTLRGFTLEFKYYTTRINGQKKKVYDCYYFTKVLYGNFCVCAGNEWELVEYKNKLKFNHEFKNAFGYGYNVVYAHLLYNETNNNWDIRKLTDKELILETINSYNQTVKLKFNRL